MNPFHTVFPVRCRLGRGSILPSLIWHRTQLLAVRRHYWRMVAYRTDSYLRNTATAVIDGGLSVNALISIVEASEQEWRSAPNAGRGNFAAVEAEMTLSFGYLTEPAFAPVISICESCCLRSCPCFVRSLS